MTVKIRMSPKYNPADWLTAGARCKPPTPHSSMDRTDVKCIVEYGLGVGPKQISVFLIKKVLHSKTWRYTVVLSQTCLQALW